MKIPLSDEDIQLFRESMRGVKPMAPQKTIHPPKSAPAPIRKQRPIAPAPVTVEKSYYLSSHVSNPVDAESIISYHHPNLPKRQMPLLRKGAIAIDGRLDLHGLLPEEAQTRLISFLNNARQQAKRCVLIIHGKGGKTGEKPVIKNLVAHWLKQLPFVLAYHSCPPRLGGTGALLALLKPSSSPETMDEDRRHERY